MNVNEPSITDQCSVVSVVSSYYRSPFDKNHGILKITSMIRKKLKYLNSSSVPGCDVVTARHISIGESDILIDLLSDLFVNSVEEYCSRYI